MLRNSMLYALILVFVAGIALSSSIAGAQVLGRYTPPYTELNLPGKVYSAYFDGVKLWVVYSEADSTHIALYIYKNGTFIQDWVASVQGTPVKVAVDNKLEYLAVVTSWKILAVYDVRGMPVLLLDRGFRFNPIDLELVSTKRGSPDVVLVVDKDANRNIYWVYAYPLTGEVVKRSELMITPTGFPNMQAFNVIIPRLAEGRQGAPYVIVVAGNVTSLNYSRYGANVKVLAYDIVYQVYRVKRDGLNVNFQQVYEGSVTLGYEIGESPYFIASFDYVAGYVLPSTSILGNTTLLVISAKLQEIQVPNVTTPLPPSLTVDGLIVIDIRRNESIIRYSDANIPLLDFYILGGPALSSSITATGDKLLVGSNDYNVYVFSLDPATKTYTILYSVSLGSPVDVVEAAPVPSIVIAGSTGGVATAFNVLTGSIYWRLPAQAQVTSISVTGSNYAAIGTASGRLFAFTNAPSLLHYLGFIVRSKTAENNTLILSTPTNITIVGVYNNLLVEMNYTVQLADIISGAFYTLLPATNYTVIVDNPVLGVAKRVVALFADVYYVLTDRDFHLPLYKLVICVNDSLTGLPLNNVKLLALYTPLPQLQANQTFTLVLRKGCAQALLPRGYYYIRVASWRYHKQLEGIPQPLKLYSNLQVEANATPYTSLLSFRVITSYGMPLSGVNITLVEVDLGLRLSVSTGGGGTAILSGVPYGVYRVTISYPYTLPYTTRLVVNASSVLVNATLKPRVYYVTILPVDSETGAPVKGAVVEITRSFDHYTVRAVLEKGYAVVKLDYGDYTVRIEATGYKPETFNVVVDRDMLLKPLLTPIIYTVSIDVIDALYQRPMPAKIVVYNVELLKRYESLTRTGHAVFQLRAGTYKVYVYPFYGLPAVATLHVPASTSLIVEVEPRNYTVTVIPLDADLKKPLSLLGVRASGVITCADTGNWTMVWRNGSLTAVVPYSLSCRLVLTAPGYTRNVVNLGSIDSNRTISVVMEPQRYPLTLKVLSTYGIPLPFTAVLREERIGVIYKVNGTGSAVIDVRPGNYTMIVTAEHHSPAKLNVSVRKAESIRVRLKPRIYTLSVSLVDADTGKPVPRATLRVERIAPKPGKPLTINVLGGVASIPLPWGTYRITATAPGYLKAVATVTLPSKTLTVAMTPVRVTVVVTVVDKLTKKPIPNATLSFFGLKSGYAVQVRTDKKGVTKVDLRADVYRVVVTAPLHLGVDTELNLLNATKEVKTSIMLPPVEYTLTLSVYDALTGAAYKGKLTIEVDRLEGGYRKTITATGPTANLALPYGTYKITVKAEKYTPKTIKVKLNASTSKKVYLERIKYTVRVKVIDARFGRPVANALVAFTLAGKGLTVYTGITDSKGEVSASIPWGNYILTVRAGGYKSETRHLQVTTNNLVVAVFLQPLLSKIVMDLLPAAIIGGAIVGSTVWVVRRIRRKPAALEFEEEEE